MEEYNQTKILEILLDNLDDSAIWKARLICKKWNDEAIRSIRKKIQAKKFKCKSLQVLFPGQLLRSYYEEWPLDLENSEILDIYLSNMVVTFWSGSEMTSDHSEPLLLKYGSNAKELDINTDRINPERLVSLFTDICPNIEKFEMSTIISTDEDEAAFDFSANQMLNIKYAKLDFTNLHRRKMLGRLYEDETMVVRKNLHAFHTVLKHSPKLSSIKIRLHVDLGWDLFFTGLSATPEISLNLTELILTGNFLDRLHLFSKTPFGPKLTKVILDNRPQSPLFPDDMKDQIHQFLKTIGPTLKHLEFRQLKGETYAEIEAFEGEPSLVIEDKEVNYIFPEMPLLKKFNTFFKFESFGFLSRMPNLIELGLTKITNPEEILSRPCLQNQIEKLTMDKWEYPWDWKTVFVKIFSSDAIQKINLLFPKLTEFYMELIPPKVLTCVGLKLWFDDICKQISLMQNLESLYILVFPSDYDRYKDNASWDWYSQVDLEDGFDFLKTTPNLKSLILGHALIIDEYGGTENDGRVVFFPRAPLLKLIEAPKLTRLKLSGLIIDGNAKDEVEVSRNVSRLNLCRLIVNAIDALDEKEVAEVDEFYDTFAKSRVKLSVVKNKYWIGRKRIEIEKF